MCELQEKLLANARGLSADLASKLRVAPSAVGRLQISAGAVACEAFGCQGSGASAGREGLRCVGAGCDVMCCEAPVPEEALGDVPVPVPVAAGAPAPDGGSFVAMFADLASEGYSEGAVAEELREAFVKLGISRSDAARLRIEVAAVASLQRLLVDSMPLALDMEVPPWARPPAPVKVTVGGDADVLAAFAEKVEGEPVVVLGAGGAFRLAEGAPGDGAESAAEPEEAARQAEGSAPAGAGAPEVGFVYPEDDAASDPRVPAAAAAGASRGGAGGGPAKLGPRFATDGYAFSFSVRVRVGHFVHGKVLVSAPTDVGRGRPALRLEVTGAALFGRGRVQINTI